MENQHGNTHNHQHCHCVHYCPVCNVVYCCKCGQQWGQNWGYYCTYPYSYGWGGSSGNITSTIMTCGGHTHA